MLGPSFAAAVGNAYAVTRLEEERNVLTGRTWEVRPSSAVDDPGALLDDTLAQLVLPEDQHAATAQLETSRVLAPGALGEVMLMAKPDACAHLDLEGRCPAAPGEVAVLAGDAEEDGHELGDRIELGEPFGTLTLVGTYAYPSGPTVSPERRETLEDFWFEPVAWRRSRPRCARDARSPTSPGSRRPTSSLPTSSPGWRRACSWSGSTAASTCRPTWTPPTCRRWPSVPPRTRRPQQLAVGTAAEISNNDLDGIVADVERERRVRAPRGHPGRGLAASSSPSPCSAA